MKQRKTSKLIILALSLALLIGSAVGIAASAADATAPVILSKNVAADGNFCLMFAVDPATCAGDEVTLTVYNTNPEGLEGDALANATVQTITKAVSDTQTEDLDGDRTPETDVLVFTTKGVAAKDIADEWYITVTSGGLTSTEVYSVREYAFERLYKDQTILAAGGTYEYRQKQFYLSILAVGSTAQDLLVNAELGTGEEPERLANEYSYAAISKGSFSGDLSGTYGFVEIGDSLTLTEDAGFTDPSWKVYTYGTNGALDTLETVALGSTIEIKGNTVVVPGWAVGKTPGKYFTDLGDEALAFDGSTSVPGAISLNTAAPGTGSLIGHHEIVSAIGRGNVLNIGKIGYTWGEVEGKSPTLTTNTVDKANATGNTFVIEMDIKIDLTHTYYNSSSEYSAASTAMQVFSLLDSTGATITNWNSNCVETDGTLSAETPFGGDEWNINNKSEIEFNKWYNLCLEITKHEGTYNRVSIYLDGVYQGYFNVGSQSGFDINTIKSIKLTWQPRTVAETYIDNLFVGIVEK